MAVDKAVYSPHEFQVGVVAETTLGTANTGGTFRLINIGEPWTWEQGIVRTTDQRNGAGRTFKKVDHFATDMGGQTHSIKISTYYDTSLAQIILENCAATTIGTGPESIAIPVTYTPAEHGHGDTLTDNTGTLTLALISPETNETIYLFGGVITEVTVTAEGTTDGGRAKLDFTYETRYRPMNGSSAPTTTAAGTSYKYLRQLTQKTINGDVVLGKAGYTLKNPLVTAGFQGNYGDPEVLSRGVPNIDFRSQLSVKYDANTANMWEWMRITTTFDVTLSNNATWSNATWGWKIADAALVAGAQPTATDAGAFMDLEFLATADTSGDLVEIIVK